MVRFPSWPQHGDMKRHHTSRLFTFLFAALAPTTAFATGPANDDFADALTVTAGILNSGSNSTATAEPGEPRHINGGIQASGGHSVWYAWSAPADGTAIVETTGSDFDTILAMYTNSAGSTIDTLAPSLYNDDSGGVNTSKLTVPVISGRQYFFAVDGYTAAAKGMVNFKISFAAGNPVNDHFANATPLAGATGQLYATSVGATVDAGDPVQDLAGSSVWFSWTAPLTGQATFRASALLGEDATKIAAYTGATIATAISIADDSSDTVKFNVTAGTTYRLRVSGSYFSFSTGSDFALGYNTYLDRGVVSLSNKATASESNGAFYVNVSRIGSTAGVATVGYTISNGTTQGAADFTATSGVVTFADGQTTAKINLPIVNDSVFEADESFNVSLVNPGPGVTINDFSRFLTVTIQDDDTLPAPVGRFIGHNQADEHSAIDLKVSAGGMATGKLRFRGTTFAFKSIMNTRGGLTALLPRKGQSPLRLEVQFSGPDSFSFSIYDAPDQLPENGIAGRVLNFPKDTPFTGAGSYHATAMGGNSMTLPYGDSFIIAILSPSGAVKMTGKLADGTPFSASSAIAKIGNSTEFTFFTPLYGGHGELTNATRVDVANGTLDTLSSIWTRPASSAGAFKNGFNFSAYFAGSKFTAVAQQRLLAGLNASNGMGTFEADDQNNTILSKAVNVSLANLVTVPTSSADKLTIKLNAKTGLLSGSFVKAGKSVKFQGLTVQKGAGYAAGFYLEPAGSFPVLLHP